MAIDKGKVSKEDDRTMTAYTMNTEKKAMMELNLDKLDMVSGGSGDDTPGFIYKRDGEYYINTPATGGELTLKQYAELVQWIMDTVSFDVAMEYCLENDPNPNMEELLRVYGVWGLVNYYQNGLDGRSNNWSLMG